MFAKRHRRPQDEQPLVPHGLVWQAMEETAPAEKSETEVEQATPPAKPLQIVRPPIQVSECPSPAPTPANSDSLSSGLPTFWQKLAGLEIVKPVSRGDGSTMLLKDQIAPLQPGTMIMRKAHLLRSIRSNRKQIQ